MSHNNRQSNRQSKNIRKNVPYIPRQVLEKTYQDVPRTKLEKTYQEPRTIVQSMRLLGASVWKLLGGCMRMLGASLWRGWVHVCGCWVYLCGCWVHVCGCRVQSMTFFPRFNNDVRNFITVENKRTPVRKRDGNIEQLT